MGKSKNYSKSWAGFCLLSMCAVSFAHILLSPHEASATAASITGNPLYDGMLTTLLYSLIGIVMAVIAYKVVDWITPGNLSKELGQNNNIPLAILSGATVLGICIIIAAVISS